MRKINPIQEAELFELIRKESEFDNLLARLKKERENIENFLLMRDENPYKFSIVRDYDLMIEALEEKVKKINSQVKEKMNRMLKRSKK